jgi:hypothetical protein
MFAKFRPKMATSEGYKICFMISNSILFVANKSGELILIKLIIKLIKTFLVLAMKMVR